MAKRASCHTCVYAHVDRALWLRTLGCGWAAGPTCGNQPESPGLMRECPVGRICRNYRVRSATPQGKGVKTIPLGDGVYAYVDAADFEWLNQWTWRLHGGYAARHEKHNGKSETILMHREIMKPPKGKVTDHANGNKVDNTRANLRNITRQENRYNTRKRAGGSSIYKGVARCKATGRWRAQVHARGENFYLGEFDSEEEAARAYDHKAAQVFGEFARPNFPEEWPIKRRRQVHARWLREKGV